jgi:hypothetical protein
MLRPGRRPVSGLRKLAAAVLLAAAAFGAGYAEHGTSGPRCPTEDSCAVSYSGGAWHITPVVP